MFDYPSSQNTAKRLLDKFGKFGYVKLRVETGGVDDPLTGGTQGAIEDIDLFAVDLSIDKSFVDGERIKTTDRMVIMSSDTKPVTDNKVIVGTVEHLILAIEPVSPAGTDVIYKVVIRGN